MHYRCAYGSGLPSSWLIIKCPRDCVLSLECQVGSETLRVMRACTVVHMSARLAPASNPKTYNDMTLLRIPQELCDLVYDCLLNGVDSTQPRPASTVIHSSPPLPTDVTLVSLGMREDILRWWRPLSRIVIASQADHCLRTLSFKKCTGSIAMQVRANKVCLAYDCASGASTVDQTPTDHLYYHLAVHMA